MVLADRSNPRGRGTESLENFDCLSVLRAMKCAVADGRRAMRRVEANGRGSLLLAGGQEEAADGREVREERERAYLVGASGRGVLGDGFCTIRGVGLAPTAVPSHGGSQPYRSMLSNPGGAHRGELRTGRCLSRSLLPQN